MKKKFLMLPLILGGMLCLGLAAGCDDNSAHTEHVWGEYTVITEPTCEKTGEHVRTCTICGAEDPVKLMPALGHSWDEGKITTPATCETDGEKIYTCKNDPSHTKSEKIDKLGHKWKVKEITKQPTCTEKGEQVMVCENDASHTKTMDISPAGHKWGEWIWDEQGDCVTDGVRHHDCTVCDASESEDYHAPGHTWGEWSGEHAATCTEEGYASHTCTVCNTEEQVPQARLGHNWGDWQIVTEPKCETAGEKSHTCADCNTTEKVPIPALGHEYKFTTKQAATQEAEGSEEGVCALCDDKITRVIPKLDAPKGIYRIVVSKTNGRRIITWHEEADGSVSRKHTEKEGYPVYYTDDDTGENHITFKNEFELDLSKDKNGQKETRSYAVYYTTQVLIKNSKGEYVYKGSLISQRNFVFRDSLGGWIRTEEIEPHLELELPIDDYTVILSDIPDEYIVKPEYKIAKNSFTKIVPDGKGGETSSTDPKLSAETPATDPLNVYNEEVDAKGKTLSASLSIVLTSEMSDGRLPARNLPSVDGMRGGIFQGAILPDFTLTTIKNEQVMLSKVLKEKKLVILDVYFYGCTWCRTAAPDFVRFAKEHEKDIAVICLNRQDASADVANKIYDQNDVYKYPEWFYNVLDISSRFHLNIENNGKVGAPTQVVIDDGFCVCDVLDGYDDRGYDLLRRNLPGDFTDIDDTGSSGGNIEYVVPAILPTRKEWAA